MLNELYQRLTWTDWRKNSTDNGLYNDDDIPNTEGIEINKTDTNINISYIAFDECYIIAETSILFRSQYCYDLPYLISELTNISSSINENKVNE